jgi:hypothetical protein
MKRLVRTQGTATPAMNEPAIRASPGNHLKAASQPTDAPELKADHRVACRCLAD